MADEAKAEEKEIVPGIGDLQAFSQQTLKVLVGATQKANALPAPGEDHDFFYSFSDFREFRNAQGKRLLNNVHDLMRHFHVRCSWPKKGKSCDSVDIDDLFENLVEANDIILEEVDTNLDEASGLSKNKKPVINQSVQSSKPVVSSWNRRSADSGKKASPVRLLLAKNITRPQLKFKDKIDNSNILFVPIIKHKPNALKPLQLYTSDTAVPEDLSLPTAIADFVHQQRISSDKFTNRINHPYQYELEVFEPSEDQLKEETERLYSSLEETPCTLVTTVEELEELSQTLTNVTEFAVDLEHHSYRSFQGFVCLMQISTRDHDYLIDTLELRTELNMLNESFTNPNILKVFHGADMDICWLQRDFGIYVVNMFDTGQASRVLGLERLSLSYLLKKFCDVTANKQYQLADWRIRPLPAEMSHYAREDTHYLLYIYDRLHNELLRSGNAQSNLLLSVYQRSKSVCLKKYGKSLFTSQSHMNLYNKQRRPLNPIQMQVFKALYEWRDGIARQEDESCGYVLPNHMLFNLAESLPREPQGVLACCNPIPTIVKQYVNEVYHIIQTAKDSAPTEDDPSSSTRSKSQESQSTMSTARKTMDVTMELDRDVCASANGSLMTTPSKAVPFESYTPTGPKVEFAKPVVTLFDYTENSSKKTSIGLEKAKKILAGFVNPFKTVLPEPDPEVVGDNTRPDQSQASIDTINQHWKKASSEAVEEKPTTQDQSSSPESENEEEAATSIRQQIESKKRKRKQKSKQDDTSPTDKKTRTGQDDNDDNDDDVQCNPSYDTLTHKANKEFVPFDYSPGEYSKLEGDKSQAKAEVFNPYEQSTRQKKTNVPRSKVRMKSGEKSMTWSKNRTQQKKQQWPSR